MGRQFGKRAPLARDLHQIRVSTDGLERASVARARQAIRQRKFTAQMTAADTRGPIGSNVERDAGRRCPCAFATRPPYSEYAPFRASINLVHRSLPITLDHASEL